MVIAKTIGWAVLFVPLMIVVYNVPLSLLVSGYSTIRYGRVLQYHRMPCALVSLGFLVTSLVAVAVVQTFDVDPRPVIYAAFVRAGIYARFNY